MFGHVWPLAVCSQRFTRQAPNPDGAPTIRGLARGPRLAQGHRRGDTVTRASCLTVEAGFPFGLESTQLGVFRLLNV